MIRADTEATGAGTEEVAEPALFDIRERFDSVYFFIWPGWRAQLESNRWHWGKRWGSRLPVVFIQPELATGVSSHAEPEGRLENVTLLSVEEHSWDPALLFTIGFRQASQISRYMTERGHTRPLFWLYNPFLAPAYLFIPAVARVLHGSENYFDFDSLGEYFLSLYRFVIEASDMVMCCSSGVARGFAAHARRSDALVIPNGCDYAKYARRTARRGPSLDQIADWCNVGRRLAVFAGNINGRLDFELMLELARYSPETGFVYAGPVDMEAASAVQRRAWLRLLRFANVRALGPLPPADLPALYWSCDIGIIPYRIDTRMLVENGFPLKALEMASAELPVVSTLMKPLLEVAAAVNVAKTSEEFFVKFGENSRRTRSREAVAAADRLCRAYDYDRLFERMLTELRIRVDRKKPIPGDLTALVNHIGVTSYLSLLGGFTAAPSILLDQSRVHRHSRSDWRRSLLTRIPASIRRLTPEPLRRLGRRWVA
jgi:Glycosyl transferases group 1